MPSLLPPLQSGLDAPAAPRQSTARAATDDAKFADTLSRSRRASEQRDAADAPGAAEPPRQDDDVQPQEPEAADEASENAPVDAQGTADEAQGLPQEMQPVAQTEGDAAVAEIERAAASQSAAMMAAGPPGLQGARVQPAGAARNGGPNTPTAQSALHQDATDSAPLRPVQIELKDAAAPPAPSAPATPLGSHKPSTDADDSTTRLVADAPVARDPAVGRAMQVQAALAVENLSHAAPDSPAGTKPAAIDRGLFSGATTPATAAPQLQEPQSAILRGLNAMVNHSGGVMTMRLEPPELGQLRVQMTIARGMVSATFQPATAEAQAVLERTMPALRAALESHGLAAERLTVQSAPPAAPTREQPQEQPAQNRQDHDAGGGESRGRRDSPAQEHHRRAAWRDAQFEVATPLPRSLQGALTQ